MTSPTPAALSPTRPFYWSVRRELWENRSLWIAPLVVAAVVLFGFTVSLFTAPTLTTVHRTSSFTSDVAGPAAPAAPTAVTTVQQTTNATVAVTIDPTQSARTGATMTPAQRAALAVLPYDFAAVALIVTLFIVAVFYCLGALHNERRDRSILFWKSLPVPDLTTVLAKAAVPVLILPPVVFVIAIVTQLIMLAMNAAALVAHGKSVGVLWANLPLGSLSLVLVYGLVTLTLWWAPIYAWLLLVSGWAKRAPFLWAVLPPLLLALAEKIAFNTGHVASQISYRLLGSLQEAFVIPSKAALKAAGGFPNGGVPQLDPVNFLRTPGLWIGLAVAVALVAAAVWSRRYREPI